MCLYGEKIPELYRGDYRPYRRTNHALSHLYHNIQCRPCTVRSISCERLGICGMWYKYQTEDQAKNRSMLFTYYTIACPCLFLFSFCDKGSDALCYIFKFSFLWKEMYAISLYIQVAFMNKLIDEIELLLSNVCNLYLCLLF